MGKGLIERLTEDPSDATLSTYEAAAGSYIERTWPSPPAVLANAVLLHLSREQFRHALRRVRQAVTPAGLLAMTQIAAPIDMPPDEAQPGVITSRLLVVTLAG